MFYIICVYIYIIPSYKNINITTNNHIFYFNLFKKNI